MNSHGVMILQDALMQNAAFQDVCYLAEAKGQQAWRRKMVFAQDSGEAWQQIGTVCMDEVGFVHSLSKVTPNASVQCAGQQFLLLDCSCMTMMPLECSRQHTKGGL